MAWTGRETGIMFASLVVGAATGAFGWQTFADRQAQSPMAGSAAGANQAAEDLAALQSENAELRGRLDELESRPRRRSLVAAEEEPVEDQREAEVTADYAALFSDPRYREVLAEIDWETMGHNMKDMVPLIAELAEAMANGEQPSLEVVGQIQKLNGDLIAIAGVIAEGNLPGAGLNGSFTHPLVIANQFGATLQAAGLGLTEAQQQSLDVITRYYVAKDDALRQSASSDQMGLEALLQEADYKDSLYQEVRSMLTPEQQQALYGEQSQGRTRMDMFDPAVMLGQFARPLPVSDSEQLAAGMAGRFRDSLTLSDPAAAQVNDIVSKWANNLPQSLWSDKADSLEQNYGMMKSDRVREAMRYQVALIREILQKVEMSEADRAGLLQSQLILVPLPR